jgi:RNA polymerase sigma-70 factor (ECF subfamily)
LFSKFRDMSSDVRERDTAVEGALGTLRARWPAVCCEREELLEHADRVGAPTGDIALNGAELGLAYACARGDLAAIRIFEAEYVARLEPSLRRLGDGDFVDEARHALRQRMLLPPEPRIATYAGTGPLLGWLRISALRTALNLRRGVIRPADALLVEEIVRELPVEASELPRYVAVFSRAVERAFADLETRDRNLLRLHHIDGLTLDRLGELHHVHRATVARWLAQARSRIFDEVEAEVKRTFKLSPSEFQSLLGLVRSYLDASLGGLLGGLHTSEP